MKCPDCGTENRAHARFCQQCGARLTSMETLEHPQVEAEAMIEAATSESEVTEPANQATELSVSEAEPHERLPSGAESAVPVVESVQPDVGLEQGDSEEAQEIESAGDSGDTSAGATARSFEEAVTESGSLQSGEPLFAVGPVSSDRGTGEQPSEMVHQEGRPMDRSEKPAESVADDGTAEVSPSEEEPGAWAVESEEQEHPEQAGSLAEPSTVVGDTEREDVQELAEAGMLPWSDGPMRMSVLEPGTVVHGRYLVVELLSDQEGENLYRVRDLRRCAQCGSTENSPDEAFCGACGAAMERKPIATMLERVADQSDKPVDAHVEDQFVEGKAAYWVWQEARKTGPLGGAEQPMRLLVGQWTDTGRVRSLNEDSIFTLVMSYMRQSMTSQLGLFIVADGMGGQEAGEVASQTAIQAAAHELIQELLELEVDGKSLSSEQMQQLMRRALEKANERVYLERQKRENDMGTTMTGALVKDWMLYLAHVGDCRAYRWGEDGCQQLTVDHSIVASMVAAGTAKPEEIYTHPQRSVIYRCIGDRVAVEVDPAALALSPGDRLILCSDGLWEMVHDEGIADVMMTEPDPQVACRILVDEANAAGGVDNISVIVVQL